MAKILVTGSEGTLGRPLCRELVNRGHWVFGVDMMHSPVSPEDWEPYGGYTRCDIRNYRQLREVFEQSTPEYVYHLAAEFGRHNGNEFYEQCWSTNLIGTKNVIELCELFGVKLIFASSSEVYGELNKDDLKETDSETFSLRPANDYAISKWANELQIMNEETVSGLEAVRCRFFNAYGPGEHYHPYRSVVCLFTNRALHNEPWTVYEGYKRVFMYIEDFIPTLANICENFIAGEVYNIGGKDFRSVRELSDLILDLTEADPGLVVYQPEDVHNTKSKRPDCSKAESDLGHDPVWTLEQGVPAYIHWLRNL